LPNRVLEDQIDFLKKIVNIQLNFILQQESLQTKPKSRPTGVTIIAILNIIGGIIMLFGGITLVTAGNIIFPPLLRPYAFNYGNLIGFGAHLSGIVPSFIGSATVVIGGVIIAIGLYRSLLPYGLLKGIGWAWTAAVILSIISILLNALSIAMGNTGGIVSISISGAILYYLHRPHVKAYFGKAQRRRTNDTSRA
jgi:hypothetical protein